MTNKRNKILQLPKNEEVAEIRLSEMTSSPIVSTFLPVFPTQSCPDGTISEETHVILVEVHQSSLSFRKDEFSTQELAVVSPAFP